MPRVHLQAVSERLFGEKRVRRRICRDYGLDTTLAPAHAAAALVAAIGQTPGAHGSDRTAHDDRAVFRAALRALASNCRSWATFLRYEHSLAELTGDYDPLRTAADVRAGRLQVDDLAVCLPGQTSRSDARAMLLWAETIEARPGLGAELCRLEGILRDAGCDAGATVPAMAVVLGAPGREMLRRFPPPNGASTWKLAGMGPVLAAEFLRNLRWSGFKPDRHIIRLFGHWFPDVIEQMAAPALDLAKKLGTRRKDVAEFLTFSLVGAAVTPPGRSYTEVDNLVWALGAYVEKKGSESNTCYREDDAPEGVRSRRTASAT
ncbi:MAG: hypothetical protein GC161_12690 [Planctomycetaceae bacterium]|nr:hypothetical protein [Planctomycetaceae bacterium]